MRVNLLQESRWGIIALGGLFYNPLLQKAECEAAVRAVEC